MRASRELSNCHFKVSKFQGFKVFKVEGLKVSRLNLRKPFLGGELTRARKGKAGQTRAT